MSDAIHDRLIHSTKVLEQTAGEIGDSFLQYLYGMAICHLQELTGRRHETADTSLSVQDRQEIEKLAARLVALANAKDRAR